MRSIHFFYFPREIRDEIYDYALRYEKPLRYLLAGTHEGPPRSGFYTSADGQTEYDHIGYVNRQLWRETAGLEVENNTLIFATPLLKADTEEFNAVTAWSQPDGSTLFLKFLQNLHSAWILRLQDIHITIHPYDEDEEDEGTIGSLKFSSADIQAYGRKAIDAWTSSDQR
jgi:hypothetical protein